MSWILHDLVSISFSRLRTSLVLVTYPGIGRSRNLEILFKSGVCTSDGSVVSFQKTAVAVLASLAVFLKTAVAVVLKLITAVAVVSYYIQF